MKFNFGMILLLLLIAFVVFCIYKSLKSFDYKLKRENNNSIYEVLDNICKEAKIDANIQLYSNNSIMLTASVKSSQKIVVSKGIINLFETKPYVFKQMIGHEVAHIKRGELKIKTPESDYEIKRKQLIELRADINGKKYAHLSDKDNTSAFNEYIKVNNDTPSNTLKNGYFSYAMRANLSNQYFEINEDLINEAFDEPCENDEVKRLLSDLKSHLKVSSPR